MSADTYELNKAESFLLDNSIQMAQAFPDPDQHKAEEEEFVTDLAHAVGQYLGELDDDLAVAWAAHFTISLLSVKAGNPGHVRLSVSVQAPAVPAPPQATLALSEPEPAPVPETRLVDPNGDDITDVFVHPDAIKDFRKRKDWTQKQLGKEVSLSGSTICYMESGKRVGTRGEYLAMRVVMKMPVEARA